MSEADLQRVGIPLGLAMGLAVAAITLGDRAAVLAILWGLSIGSFLNVVAYRLPLMAQRNAALRDLTGDELAQALKKLGVPPASEPFKVPSGNSHSL